MAMVRFKVFTPQGEYIAAVKRPEEGAALMAFLGDGAELRDGHSKRFTVWREGAEAQPAGESYDHVAQTVWDRITGWGGVV